MLNHEKGGTGESKYELCNLKTLEMLLFFIPYYVNIVTFSSVHIHIIIYIGVYHLSSS